MSTDSTTTTRARRVALREHRHARVVEAVREYLEAHHARVVRAAELARLTGFSPFHLTRIFHAAVGVPPYAYLARVRVRRARELIARGAPLAEVTYETGFCDQSHLTRHFKRIVGVPPGRYAREVARARAMTAGSAHEDRARPAGTAR